MSQRGSPERRPPATPATPAPARGGARSPLASPLASPAPAPAGAPAGAPGGAPGSPAPSASPLFARTPHSGAASPLASPSPAGAARAARLLMTPAPAAAAASQRSAGRGAGAGLGSPGGAGSPAASSARRRAAHRGFLGSPPRAGEFSEAAGADPDDGPEDAGAEEGNFLYGTDINENTVVRHFLRFVWRFRLPDTQGQQSHYIQELHRAWEECTQRQQGIKLKINAEHIHRFSPVLYGHMVNFPTEVIPIFDRELWSVSVRELRAEPEDLGSCQAQVHSLLDKDCRIMRSMNPTDIEKLMCVKGIVIRVSDLMPDMLSAVFRCTTEDCKNEIPVPLSHWAIEEPTRCELCGGNHSFAIVHNESTFADRQLLKLQEPPELVPDGETPQNVAVCVFDDLVDAVRPGDRVEVTGIYRASPVRPIKNFKQCSSVYRTYIDSISISFERKGRIDAMTAEHEFEQGKPPMLSEQRDLDPSSNSEEDISWNQKVRELAGEKDADGRRTVVGKLVQSFAPSIYDEDEVKKGLLCQLFNGTPKAAGKTIQGRCRPEINTLLCGDPSTAKSQLLQYAFKLAPRGIYTSGKGSSAVGLTASINKDPATGELVLESGALVLSDRGVCCIDEFDKMDDGARAIMHEAMEQQTVSVAKAGIVTSLNARCSILASANPKESSYDPKLSVVENIHLPKNLMSRFDFIWLMLDKRDREMDTRLATHLVSMYPVSGVRKRTEPAVEPELFRKYVSFARRWVFPKMSDEARAALKNAYLELRNQGTSREAITATPRILESLIRISESLAKMELREDVSRADVDEATRLLKAATYQAAIDPETGKLDMAQLTIGMGAARRKRSKEIETMLQEILYEKQEEGAFGVDQLKLFINERLGDKKEKLATDAELYDALGAVEKDGLIRRNGKQVQIVT